MAPIRYVSYTDKEREIIKRGITAIQEILMGTDADKKRSLLLCLDWFMDPYYGQDISDIYKELVDLLQAVIISPNEYDVIEDALNLLSSYAWGPFEILESHYEEMDLKIKPEVYYVINMHRIATIEKLLIDKCIRIYKEIKEVGDDIPSGFRIIHNAGLSVNEDCFKTDMIVSMWEWNDGKLSTEEIPTGLSENRLHENGKYYHIPEMHFNIDLKGKKVILAFYFAKRYGRCFSYTLVYENEEYGIVNQKVEWVS